MELMERRSAVEKRTHPAWRRLAVAFALIGTVGFTLPALAQVGNARVRGVVADPQGGVIPHAHVELKNEQTGVKTATASDGAGQYVFPEVPLGKYDLRVDAPGFKSFQQLGIQLVADQQLTLNAPMAVGEATETISVTGEGTQVDTQTGTIKNNIDQKSIQDLPLASRDVRQ